MRAIRGTQTEVICSSCPVVGPETPFSRRPNIDLRDITSRAFRCFRQCSQKVARFAGKLNSDERIDYRMSTPGAMQQFRPGSDPYFRTSMRKRWITQLFRQPMLYELLAPPGSDSSERLLRFDTDWKSWPGRTKNA